MRVEVTLELCCGLIDALHQCVLVAVQVFANESLVREEEVAIFLVVEFVFRRDGIVLSAELDNEVRIKEQIHQVVLLGTGIDFLIPIVFGFLVSFENRFPVLVVFLLVVLVEEIVLQQFGRGQFNAKRVDGIEDLLLVLLRIQVDGNEVDVLLDLIRTQFIRINVLVEILA